MGNARASTGRSAGVRRGSENTVSREVEKSWISTSCDGPARELPDMADLVFLLLTALLFAGSVLYTRRCDRL
jgi:hypothetical protein